MPTLPPFPQLRASNYGHWFAVVATAAVAAAMGLRSQGRVEFNTAAGIAQALGRYQRCTARPQDFVWERSQGLLHDLFVGRSVLFLCGELGKRDLYRGRIRLSPEGQALHVVAGHRLTQTPNTDETDLMAASGRAAVLQRQNQHVVAARIIDWNGKPPSTVSWWRRIVSNWMRYGAITAPIQSQLVFPQPIQSLRAELGSKHLRLAVGESGQALALRLADNRVLPAQQGSEAVRAWATPDSTMSFAAIGKEWLGMFSASGQGHAKAAEAPATALPATAPAQDFASSDGPYHFPPHLPIHPAKRKWEALTARGHTHGAPPALMRASSILSKDGTTTPIEMVAIDSRQLVLGFAAGYAGPRVRDIARGSGQIPPELREKVVAVFNGIETKIAPKSMPLGLVLNRKTIVAPRTGAATFRMDRWDQTDIFPWPGTARSLENVPWLIQESAFVGEAAIQHSHRKPKARSAICRTSNGPLVYLWSPHTTPQALAKAAEQVGCARAFPLASGIGRIAFSVAKKKEPGQPEFLRLDGQTKTAAKQLWQQAPQGVFYLYPRRQSPLLPVPDNSRGNLRVAKTAQPNPTWLPAIHRSRQQHQGSDIELWMFSIPRFQWSLVPGTSERLARTSRRWPPSRSGRKPYVVLGLGRATRRRRDRYGLVIDGMIVRELRPDRGVLRTEPTLGVEMAVPGLSPQGDASELLLIAENGRIRSEGRALSARKKRSAACIAGDQRFLVALGTSDNDEPLAQSLLKLGCRRIVRLNRGKQVKAFIHLKGGTAPPQATYAQTTLMAFDRHSAAAETKSSGSVPAP